MKNRYRTGIGILRRGIQRQENVVLLITIALGLFFTLALEGFATIGNLLTIAHNTSILAILALGMGVVVIARGLDLSQIGSMALGTIVALHFMKKGMAIPLTLLMGLPVALVIGLTNGFLVAFMEVPALIVTLATCYMIYGFAYTFFFGSIFSEPPMEAKAFLLIGQGDVYGIPIPFIIADGLAIVVHLLLSRTRIGLFIYAHGENPETSRISGIPVRLLTLLEYVVCSALGYGAGIIMASSSALMDANIINSTMIFDVFLVVVLGGISLIGGRGGVWSVICGVALIGVLVNGMVIANINNYQQSIIKGAILIAAIILDNRLHPVDEETMRQGETI